MTSQAERRATTRQALLAAATELLVAEGLTGFTTAAVTQRAGLSNGALFSHFPTRLDLLAATVEHMLAQIRVGYEHTFANIEPSAVTPVTLLELLWETIEDPHFGAVLSVYTQARTDRDLLAAIHDIVVQHGSFVGQINRSAVALFVADPAEAARLTQLGTIAILAMQGLLVSHMVGASMGGQRDLIRAFAETFEAVGTRPPGAPATQREH